MLLQDCVLTRCYWLSKEHSDRCNLAVSVAVTEQCDLFNTIKYCSQAGLFPSQGWDQYKLIPCKTQDSRWMTEEVNLAKAGRQRGGHLRSISHHESPRAPTGRFDWQERFSAETGLDLSSQFVSFSIISLFLFPVCATCDQLQTAKEQDFWKSFTFLYCATFPYRLGIHLWYFTSETAHTQPVK